MGAHYDAYQKAQGESGPDWRRQSGVADEVGRPRAAPPMERSTSEGDMGKNSYRPSYFPRLFQRAVCNDDGFPISAGVEALLLDILEELRALRAERAEP